MVSKVVAVALSGRHSMSKPVAVAIELIAGIGVAGDAHAGVTVKHRSRVARDPTQPNLRQVHLMAAEFHDELAAQGFRLAPGQMGENLTTQGLDLIRLGAGTRLRLGPQAVVEITGLRNPCTQLDRIQPGLMGACLGHDAGGNPLRKAGVMAIVLDGGTVTAGDAIIVEPPERHEPLKVV
jgi:MOSC domain-containing protein YiiM